jgi:hypothetical protein
MAEAPRRGLSGSARLALRWAWTAAAARTGSDPPDSLDLLVGIALAHLRDGPAEHFFAWFDLPLGAVLTAAGPRPYAARDLLAAMQEVRPDVSSPIQGEAADVVRHALGELPTDDDGYTTLTALFCALLDTPNTASTAVRRLLADRGEDPAAVVRTCRENLGQREDLATALERHHPRRPVELPRYAADRPPARTGAGRDEPDLVGIRPEVDAFAFLIASRRLVPPLAIGLFGDWGSGKSYFLRSVQQRVDAIGAAAPADSPDFHRAVAQIEFNAWQYVEGDLWASLLEHLFRNLRTSPDDSDDLLGARQKYWIEQIDDADAARALARAEREEKEREREAATAEVGRRTVERDVAVAELERRRRERPLAGWTPSARLLALRDEAMRRAGLDGVATEAENMHAELRRSAETLQQAGAVLEPMRRYGWRFALAVVVLVLLAPVVAIVLGRLDLSPVVAAAGSLAWLLATAVGYLKVGNDAVRSGLAAVAEAQRELTTETEKARRQLDAQVEEAVTELARVDGALKQAIDTERALDERARELAVQLAEVTPARVLADFTAERTGSDDYRRHLGVPAVVRRDLERLARLVTEQKAGDEHAVDRVVLYIDDLDRCPTHVVIKVLEAVHLLLAFPLFVVVVAVDSRWLESSLREHYGQLDQDGARPADYLEKIFQVPFWVRALDADTRRAVLHGLLAPSVRGDAAPTTVTAADTSLVPPTDWVEFDRIVRSFAETAVPDRLRVTAADLSLSATELARIEELAPLLDATPRALKRFANVYLLLRSVGRGRGWDVPDDGRLALLLALVSAMPELVGALGGRRIAEGPPLPLGALPTDLPSEEARDQRRRLGAWLADHPDWKQVDLQGLGGWVEPVLRFTFGRLDTGSHDASTAVAPTEGNGSAARS